MSVRRTLAIAGALAAAGTITACGSGSDEPSAEQVAEIRAEVLREVRARERERRADAKLRQLERELRALKRRSRQRPRAAAGGGSAPAPPSGGGGGSGSSCGGGLSVNSVTSCPFAQNVADAYRGSGGASSIDVYSPVTGTTYTMSCSGGVPVTCSGGNGAVVSIR